jgi:flagellar biosynthesis chaperone FliJ
LSRLLSALNKILRVKQHNIDQLRQRASLLTEQIALRQLAIEKNISHINTERLIASVNITGSDTLEVFVKQKTQQNKQYNQECEELQLLANEVQEQLYNAYVEQKQFEKVKNSEQIKIDNEEKRKEIQVIDEIARQININNLTKN